MADQPKPMTVADVRAMLKGQPVEAQQAPQAVKPPTVPTARSLVSEPAQAAKPPAQPVQAQPLRKTSRPETDN